MTNISPNMGNVPLVGGELLVKAPVLRSVELGVGENLPQSVLNEHYLRDNNSSVSTMTKRRAGQLGIHSSIPSSKRDFSLQHRIQQGARIAVTRLQTGKTMVGFPVGARDFSLLRII